MNAQGAGGDYEVLGSFRAKSFDDFRSRLSAELFEEAARSDRLFESMELELNLDLGPLNGLARFSRSVHVDNPELTTPDIANTDYAFYRVTNSLYTGIDVDPGFGLWQPHGRAGVVFSVSNQKVPAISKNPLLPKSSDSIVDICQRSQDSFAPLLAQQSLALLQGHDCKAAQNSWFEALVQQINRPLRRWMQDYFVDSEKNQMYADNVLEPVTNYTRYGFPVRLDAFFDNSPLLSVGDSVQHTAFLGIDPTKLGWTTYYSAFLTRYAKDIRIKKLGDNRILLQLTEFVSQGSDFQLFRFRPRILWLLSYNFGQADREDLQTFTYKRVYELDLLDAAQLAFVEDLLAKAYIPDFGLARYESSFQPVLLPKGVKAKPPVFIRGEIANYQFLLRLPGAFKIDSGYSSKLQQAHIGAETHQAEADKFFEDKKRWQVLASLFGRTDRETTCRLNAKTYAQCDQGGTQNCQAEQPGESIYSDRIALNIDCYHSEAYPKEDWPLRAWDMAQMLMDGGASTEFQAQMQSLDAKQVGRLSFTANLSFHHEHIERFLERADFETVALELADIFMGPAVRQHWQEVGVRRVFHDAREARREAHGPLATKHTPRYCRSTQGIVGPYRGFEDLFLLFGSRSPGEYRCLALVDEVIADLTRRISRIRQQDRVLDRLQEMLDAYRSEDITTAMAVLLQRLSRDIERPIRYTYSVDGSHMLEAFRFSNGSPYSVTHRHIADEIADAADFRDTHPRLRNGLLMKPKQIQEPSQLRLDLFTSHRFPPDALIEVEFKEFVAVLKNRDRGQQRRVLPIVEPIAKYRLPLAAVRDLGRIVNGARFVYEDIALRVPANIRKDKTHIAYLRVLNSEGDWLSEEQVFSFHWQNKFAGAENL